MPAVPSFQPDGRTQVFAVLGHPVGHSLSPAMHNAAFRALGRNALYVAFDVAPERWAGVLPALRALGCGGVNVTVPHKEAALRAMDRLDESARLAGAVNTVAFTADGLVGHNTDGWGFLRAAREAFGSGPAGRRLFVLGAGGAGRTVALAAARAGAAAVTVCDADRPRAERVAAEARAAAPQAEISIADPGDAGAAACGAEWVIQCTPLGLRTEDPLPLPAEAFRAGQCVFDLIYMYPETPVMTAARAAGARAANGLDMLLYQGARAFEIWTGVEPPADIMRAALRKAVYGPAA